MIRPMKILDNDFALSKNFDTKELYEFMSTIKDLPCYVQEEIHNDLSKKAIKNEMRFIMNHLTAALTTMSGQTLTGISLTYIQNKMENYIKAKYCDRYIFSTNYDAISYEFNFKLSTKFNEYTTYLSVSNINGSITRYSE